MLFFALIAACRAVNPSYYWNLQYDWKPISFYKLYMYVLDFEIKEAYKLDELKELVSNVIELDKNKN